MCRHINIYFLVKNYDGHIPNREAERDYQLFRRLIPVIKGTAGSEQYNATYIIV
jgi:hypothetical protein